MVAVFSLYIACTWIDPADPGVRLEKQKDISKKEVAASGRYGQPMEEPKQTIMDLLANRESGYGTIEESGCKPMSEKLIEKSCCKRKREDEESSLDSQSLYCSICDAEVCPPLIFTHLLVVASNYGLNLRQPVVNGEI